MRRFGDLLLGVRHSHRPGRGSQYLLECGDRLGRLAAAIENLAAAVSGGQFIERAVLDIGQFQRHRFRSQALMKFHLCQHPTGAVFAAIHLLLEVRQQRRLLPGALELAEGEPDEFLAGHADPAGPERDGVSRRRVADREILGFQVGQRLLMRSIGIEVHVHQAQRL